MKEKRGGKIKYTISVYGLHWLVLKCYGCAWHYFKPQSCLMDFTQFIIIIIIFGSSYPFIFVGFDFEKYYIHNILTTFSKWQVFIDC